MSKKFWEEVIAYSPLIRHGPYRKLLLRILHAPGSNLGQGTIERFSDLAQSLKRTEEQ
jgi:hypothetical protein